MIRVTSFSRETGETGPIRAIHARRPALIFASKIALGPILPVDVPSLFQWADDSEDTRLNESYRPLNWHRQEAFWMNASPNLV